MFDLPRMRYKRGPQSSLREIAQNFDNIKQIFYLMIILSKSLLFTSILLFILELCPSNFQNIIHGAIVLKNVKKNLLSCFDCKQD